MEKITGNLVTLAQQGEFDVIVHGCNCYNTMGAGIAKQIRKVFPEAWVADQNTKIGDVTKLGTYSLGLHKLPDEFFRSDLYIVNAYTQDNWKGMLSNYQNPIDYDAVSKVFALIRKNFQGMKIAYPKIGAGLAGGDWEKIESIIDYRLEGCDHILVEWDQ